MIGNNKNNVVMDKLFMIYTFVYNKFFIMGSLNDKRCKKVASKPMCFATFATFFKSGVKTNIYFAAHTTSKK